MRHVTDGELHAFLDGAVDLLPGGRGTEVRDHIAECSTCRERLQDEERVRSRATEILGDPDFSEVGLPTFEELRERAEASGSEEEEKKARYRGPIRGLPLAWAATIVMAMGVGWMGSQVWHSIPYADGRGTPALDYRASESPEASSMDSVSDSLTAAGPQSIRVDAMTVTPSPEPEERAEDTPSTEAAAVGVQLPPRSEVAREQRQTPAGAELSERKVQPAVGEAVMDEVLNLIDSSGAVSSFAPAVREMEGVPAHETPVSDSLENSLAVPGLKVVSIEWEERVLGEKALLIRQLLSPGDTLELRYLGLLLGTDPDPRRREMGDPAEEAPGRRVYANVLEASLPPGWNQVVMERGRGLLVARAPIEEDHLKALLKTLH